VRALPHRKRKMEGIHQEGGVWRGRIEGKGGIWVRSRTISGLAGHDC